jgi:HSP20 family protein
MDALFNGAIRNELFGPEFTKNFFSIDFDKKQAYPKADIIDEDDQIIFEVDVQGLTKDDVQVTVEPSDERNVSYLVIAGGQKRDVSDEEKTRNYIRKEIKRSTWRRTWTLDEKKYNVAKIDADVENGLLVLKVPKVTETERKKEVKKIL